MQKYHVTRNESSPHRSPKITRIAIIQHWHRHRTVMLLSVIGLNQLESSRTWVATQSRTESRIVVFTEWDRCRGLREWRNTTHNRFQSGSKMTNHRVLYYYDPIMTVTIHYRHYQYAICNIYFLLLTKIESTLVHTKLWNK